MTYSALSKACSFTCNIYQSENYSLRSIKLTGNTEYTKRHTECVCISHTDIYKKIIVFQIFDMIKGNAHLAIALDNASLASDDFRIK